MEIAENNLEYKWEKISCKTHFMNLNGDLIHNNLLKNVSKIFSDYLKDKPYKLYVDEMPVYIDEDNVFIPDIMIISNEKEVDIKDNNFLGIPDLIVEIISLTSTRCDRLCKFNGYEKLGVNEYWIIDYRTKQIEVYFLKDNKFSLSNIYIDLEDKKEYISFERRECYSSKIQTSIFGELDMHAKDFFGNDLE